MMQRREERRRVTTVWLCISCFIEDEPDRRSPL
jgi:hypothetical protein